MKELTGADVAYRNLVRKPSQNALALASLRHSEWFPFSLDGKRGRAMMGGRRVGSPRRLVEDAHLLIQEERAWKAWFYAIIRPHSAVETEPQPETPR
jgi:hypothetical protein